MSSQPTAPAASPLQAPKANSPKRARFSHFMGFATMFLLIAISLIMVMVQGTVTSVWMIMAFTVLVLVHLITQGEVLSHIVNSVLEGSVVTVMKNQWLGLLPASVTALVVFLGVSHLFVHDMYMPGLGGWYAALVDALVAYIDYWIFGVMALRAYQKTLNVA